MHDHESKKGNTAKIFKKTGNGFFNRYLQRHTATISKGSTEMILI